MKKVLMVLILAAVVTGGVFAVPDDWYQRYAEGVDQKVLLNAGVGFGFGGYKMGIPPISVSADFKLPIDLPITVGGTVAFRTLVYEPYYDIDVTYFDIGIGARGAYHFGLVKNLDTYAGLTLGWVIRTTDVKYGSAYDSAYKPTYDGVSYFLFGVNIGARYFFTPFFGTYLELGYSGLQAASLGVSFKF